MYDEAIYIGDLVSVKEKLQRFIALPDWGIVLEETIIIPADIPEHESLDPIESFVVFFPASDETLTIPKNCLKKITILKE